MFYPVELSAVAEDAYDRFHARAEVFLEKGLERHPAITTFNTIQEALDETLPLDPNNPERALAGNLSFLYILRLRSILITYTVNEIKPSVIVQTISRSASSNSVRDWLANGIESGELSPILESLGIQPYLMKMQVNSRYLH